MSMQIELAKSVWTPELAKALTQMLARVNLAYLMALPGLPCCPLCAGIRRQESSVIRDVAMMLKSRTGSSLSLAAWQLAEAWKDGDDRAYIEVVPTDPNVPAGGSGQSKNCPTGQIWVVYESPPGSGNMISECRPPPIVSFGGENVGQSTSTPNYQVFRYLVHKKGNIIDIAKRYLNMGGCPCG